MKKLSILAAVAVLAAAPAIAQDVTTVDPFLATQGFAEVPAIAIVAGMIGIIAIAASSGT
ncbi:hypothetical protein [Pseudoprimorskyibacter insulae]|uniref:Ferrochelatase n=1 Tax=Pseudoprimorskyibacter insulae TaxID=1695997 RepID=A0A2R8AYT6_9RHOB|nr:hypothetical protein [Pseudoprimorskyibacter insulae]SPF81201.1 hypothetical protein PRI8871_03023 [Pseudoprimorskyibacter insulae]